MEAGSLDELKNETDQMPAEYLEESRAKSQTECPAEILLEVRDLSLWIRQGKCEISILDHLNFRICRGESWGIAGESGAGKSMTIHALTGLLPQGNVRMEGEILYSDRSERKTDVLRLSGEARQRYCCGQISLILQDSMNALNPYETVEKQWGRVIRLHRGRDEDVWEHMIRLLPAFGLSGEDSSDDAVRWKCVGNWEGSRNQKDSKSREKIENREDAGHRKKTENEEDVGSREDAIRLLKKYPHQISGGMKQRIAIAMALESPAELLIADEPTTALDALNQRRIADLIRTLCRERNLTLLYVSHNLGILKELCTHVMVMRDGKIVEQGRAEEVFGNPKHPYTKQLISQTRELQERV